MTLRKALLVAGITIGILSSMLYLYEVVVYEAKLEHPR